MEFCPKCKGILLFEGNGDNAICKCSKCDFVLVGKELVSNENIKQAPKKGKGAVKEENIYATYKHDGSC